MAYSTSNPPRLLVDDLSGAGGQGKVWIYVSTDAETAFDDTDYITNALELGMVTGNFVLIVDTTNGLSTIGQVTVDADGNGTLSALTAFA
jgi:hypothetical protein